MNRKERRAAAKQGKRFAPQAPSHREPAALNVADMMAEANICYQQGQYARAEDICHKILAHDATHVDGANLLGLIAQASGQHRRAIKYLRKAIASGELNAACHYNIACSYQAAKQRSEAEAHFRKAIALGLSDRNIEEFILQNSAVSTCIERIRGKWPLRLRSDELFGPAGIDLIADDIFLQCAMELVLIGDLHLEALLTQLRSELLGLAMRPAHNSETDDERLVGLFSSLAQQCFISEYIYAQSDEETRLAASARDTLADRVTAGDRVPPLLLIAAAAYFPLHSLSIAETLLKNEWPEAVNRLLRRQVREPLEEKRDRGAIPALTEIEDSVSLQVMKQYEENPYPRWIVTPLAILAGEQKRRTDAPNDGEYRRGMNILVAGCGTGQHAMQLALIFPDARVLAVDISLTSLAYARRKTREEGLQNLDYAQADILKIDAIGRTFDRIESVGVLHHLGDPKAGWRALVSLLRPDGVMRIGLYSETARRAIVEARALIAERGYRPTDDDIRRFRDEVSRFGDARRAKVFARSSDFYSTSGCRDMFFNVMEHRFTIPQIKEILSDLNLSFGGFQDLTVDVIEKFQRRFPAEGAITDLDCWDAFEGANPDIFMGMYVFLVRKN